MVATPITLKKLELVYCGRNRIDEPMTWLNVLIVTKKTSQLPANRLIDAFEVRHQGGDLHWYNQLGRRSAKTWTLQPAAFLCYYCNSKSAMEKTSYYNATHRSTELILNFPLEVEPLREEGKYQPNQERPRPQAHTPI
jgi:hypothetical protein